MSHEHGDNRHRRFDIDQEDVGEQTVRILPEPYDVGHASADNHTPRQEKPSTRPGTLYTHAPSTPLAAYEPEEHPYQHQHRSNAPQQREYFHEDQRLTSTARTEEKPAAAQVRRGPSSCAILAGTFSLLALSCALLAFATVQGGLDSLGKLGGIFPKLDLPITPTVTIDTRQPAVIEKIRALSKLETVHYEMEKVISGKSSTSLPEFLVGDKILLVAHGEVVAGIDLSKIKSEDIVVDGDQVTITVPEPEILYSKLDNDKTYVYDRQTGIFSKPDPNLETQIRQTAEQEIVNAALEDGILARAQANGEQVIRTLLAGLGYPDVEIVQQP